MKIQKTVFIGIVMLALASAQAYGEPGKGKGKAKGHDKQDDTQTNNGQSNNAQSVERRTHEVEKGRKDADIRANIPDNAKGNNSIVRASTRIDRGRSAEHLKKEAEEKVKGFLNALAHARWSYNPHDERGQGNMGKLKMQDPYGFDKDSGREGSERGRPIQESSFNLADILSIDFSIGSWVTYYFRTQLEKYYDLAERYPMYNFSNTIAYYENFLNTYNEINVGRGETIDYTLTLNTPEGFEGTTLLVTRTLTTISSYQYNPAFGKYISYDAGQVLSEETQEIVLGSDNTFSFSYDPPPSLVGGNGLNANFDVTVTEPVSGQSYTINYGTLYLVNRCPYGKVYNAKTHESVVGAKVTVHFEDGSIVSLDKASNPTAKNPQITDATGRYGVKLETNRKYYITAKADGYKDYKSEVFTEKWHVLREDVALEPVEEVASNLK